MSDRWMVGGWQVDLREGWIRKRGWRQDGKIRPDARLMKVLAILIRNPGTTISIDALLKEAWPGRVVGRDSVTTAIYQLRQHLDDDADAPRYIASEHRNGYRLIAPVSAATRWWPARVAMPAAASLVLAAVIAGWTGFQPADKPPTLYVEPILNYAESPVQGPLFTAVQSTLLSELIQTLPGRVRIEDSGGATLRLQAMMVACDLGPTLVMRLLDSRSDTYVWSEAYNLDEARASTGRPTLVERAAMDVGAAMP